MRIGMAQCAFGQQSTRFDQGLDDRPVCIAILAFRREDALAGEDGDMRGEGTVFLDDVERVGILRGVAGVFLRYQHEVVRAVAGCCVHEARAGIRCHIVAGQQRHVELVPLAAQRMRRDGAARIGLTGAAQCDLGMFGGLVGQRIGEEQHLAHLRERTFLDALHFVYAVVHRGRKRDGAIARDGPGSGRPDDDGRVFVRAGQHWKLHIDRRALFLVVLDLGLGERGHFHRRPHHRAEAAIEQSVRDEFVQLAGDDGFGAVVHRGVGLVPLAHAAHALELRALHVDPVIGEVAAVAAQLVDGDVVLRLALGAILLLDLPFDRQAVAVPAGDIRRVETEEAATAHHDILQHLVEAGAGMDFAVGVGRPVMQHEERATFRLFADAAIEVHRLPALKPFRLGRRQAGLHREVGRGQEQGGAIVAGGVGRFWHCLFSDQGWRVRVPASVIQGALRHPAAEPGGEFEIPQEAGKTWSINRKSPANF